MGEPGRCCVRHRISLPQHPGRPIKATYLCSGCSRTSIFRANGLETLTSALWSQECSHIMASSFLSECDQHQSPQNPGKSRAQGGAWEKHLSERLQFLSPRVAANPRVALTKEDSCKRSVGFLRKAHSLRNPLQGILRQLLWGVASLTSRVTFLWGDWNAHSAMASKASFQRVSMTQAAAVDARRQSSSTYIFAAPPQFNQCGWLPTGPPTACHCSKRAG